MEFKIGTILDIETQQEIDVFYDDSKSYENQSENVFILTEEICNSERIEMETEPAGKTLRITSETFENEYALFKRNRIYVYPPEHEKNGLLDHFEFEISSKN